MYQLPSVAEFKARFKRDFPYTSDPTDLSMVQDEDIDTALSESQLLINPGLFESQVEFSIAYLYLTAHNLVTNIQNSSQGMAGSFNWLTASRGVGSVSQGFQFPQYILDHPLFAAISLTTYGARYLTMVIVRLAGNVGFVGGATQA